VAPAANAAHHGMVRPVEPLRPPGADLDVIAVGSERLSWAERWQQRWRATARLQRAVLALSLLLAVTAAAVGVVAAHTQPRRQVRTVIGAPRSVPVTVDATGCPVTAQCTVREAVPPGLAAAFTRAFPTGAVTSGELTSDERSGQVYRALLIGQVGPDPATTDTTEPATVTAAAQCVPGGTSTPEQVQRLEGDGYDLSDNFLIRWRELDARVSGSAGCTVTLRLDSPGRSLAFEAGGLRLVRDPAAQLPP
jgi:hypothetical protein